jgi:Xaa-Pro aminopeptidase
MRRRREALEGVLRANGCAHALVYGANRSGTAVGWLTRWPVTREACAVFTPGQRDLLLVNFYNHVPNARRMATEADVSWAGAAMPSALEELDRRDARSTPIGIVGPLGFADYLKLQAFASEVVDLNPSYTRLRLIKSAEEIEWLREGALLTDAAVAALQHGARPGMTEAELGDIVERAYVGRGATTHIHYFGATSMSDPQITVPAQWPSERRLQIGDALICEVSASYWDYPGQLLRTFSVRQDPEPLFARLHEVADAAFDAVLAELKPGAAAAVLVEAAGVIEDAGFTTGDDLVHGFVGGYFPPVLGSRSRTLEVVPDFLFESGMTIVVQPNVQTLDGRAGVQTGELVLVTDEGTERLHSFPRGLLRLG